MRQVRRQAAWRGDGRVAAGAAPRETGEGVRRAALSPQPRSSSTGPGRRRFFILACLAATILCATSIALATPQQTVYGEDLRGRPVTRLANSSDLAAVLFFVATDCPISNRYVPEIQRLEKEFAARHVAFWLIYPNDGETAQGVLQHRTTYGLAEGSVLLHPTRQLLALAHATVTPQSAVFVPAGSSSRPLQAVYSGRIDDRYLDIGRQRPQATRHDLAEAITAVLEHRAVTPAAGPPVGCGIIRLTANSAGTGKP